MCAKNKKLIIKLIQQDLKHNQLTTGLRQLGLDTNLHNLEIMDIVAQLMGISEPSEKWIETYIDFLNKADQYNISNKGNELIILAKNCYEKLILCMNKENNLQENS